MLKPDLLVLSVGIAPPPDNPVISGLLRRALTSTAFFSKRILSCDRSTSPTKANLFAAGAFTAVYG